MRAERLGADNLESQVCNININHISVTVIVDVIHFTYLSMIVDHIMIIGIIFSHLASTEFL